MTEELTPYEKAVKEAETLTEEVRKTFQAVGKMTPRIELLIVKADEAWQVVDRMLGKKI